MTARFARPYAQHPDFPGTATIRTCTTCNTPLPGGVLFCPSCGASTPTEVGVATPLDAPVAATSGTFETRKAEVQRALGAAFEVARLVGRGGFGEVWAAFDLQLSRTVAVKVLRPELVATPAFRERFRREARAVARLCHPGIVPIYHVGEANNLVFFVMPLIEGVTLKTALAGGGRLSTGEATRILVEAASALREAHRCGIVHRDLKPENVMLDGPERRVLLMDFGIAQSEDPEDRDLTDPGMVLGSPEYMSPEQATGKPQLDVRSDIYSLGVVAYRMLAGRLPFDAGTAREILAQHVLTPPESLAAVADVPEALSETVMRCLAKHPDERWQTPDEFLTALTEGELAVAGRLSVPRGSTASERAASAPLRRRRAVWLAGLVTVGVLAAAVWPVTALRARARWTATGQAAVAAYRETTDSLRALGERFRTGAVTGPGYLAARESLLLGVDARITATYGPILEDWSVWPEAPRLAAQAALDRLWAASLGGAPLALQPNEVRGCTIERRGDTVTLRDGARNDNCWWSVASSEALARPVEYFLTFRLPGPIPPGAGFGLDWCASDAECRVVFLWSGGSVEWASHRRGGGLRDRQSGRRLPALAGLHRLRVRSDSSRVRVWLDDALVLARTRGESAPLLANPGTLRLVVQSMAIELPGVTALGVVGLRR